MLDGVGLRSEEVRMVHTGSVGPKRSDTTLVYLQHTAQDLEAAVVGLRPF
jgi:hypothetical protein